MAEIIPLRAEPTTLRRPRNEDVRSREYLRHEEVEKLIDAAGRLGRHQHRDATMILVCYRHGLRVSELVALRWEQIDLKKGTLDVQRVKNGIPSKHHLSGPELRALRKLKTSYPDSPFVFATERRGALTVSGVHKILARAGVESGLPFPVHAHMLRHAAGHTLANAGKDARSIQHYLGHRSIQSTVRYTQLSEQRFKNYFPD